MASGYPPQAPDARGQVGRARPARPDDAELLAPPEVDPVQLSRSMFSQPAPRPPPAPLTNLHLKKVARLDASATNGGGDGGSGAAEGGAAGGSGGGGAAGGGSGGRASGGAAAARIRSARSHRSARSVAASSVRGGRAAFSVVSDEEVIDVDGEPTTLADDDLDLPPSPGADADDDEYDDYDDNYDNGRAGAGGAGGGGRAGGAGAGGARARGPGRGGALGMSGIAGLADDEYGGGPDPLEELEADTPAVRLAEVTADLEVAMQSSKDPWVVVQLAQLALGHAKVVWRTMPVTVREEPLLLAKAHYSMARAYQGLACDKQASDHGKQALAAIPKEVADTEAARALRTEVQVMRAEALLSSAGVPGIPPEAAGNQARKALALLVKAAGLQEPVAWTSEEVEDNDLGGVKRSTIDSVTDGGIVALMAQAHGVLAETKIKEVEAEDAERKSSLRSADEAASRLDRRTERGDAFYSAEQLDKYRGQVKAFRDEAEHHQSEMVRLSGEAERSYDAAMYCLNHVIDVEGSRLEDSVGRAGKLAHPTFQALWRRALDFNAGICVAYAYQRKDSLRLNAVNEILSAFAQYGSGGWLPPARHIQALKDKGALLVDKRDYEGATACYEELTDIVTELYENDPVRKELQVAEVLKLRGDVALASGDFRTAQHKFNQALEFYQRHLGAASPVAQDLLHRIDEVKGYLADTRVMGRLASLPSPQHQTITARATTPASGSVGGGSGGSAAAKSSPAPSVTSASVRSSSIPRPLSLAPGTAGPGSSYRGGGSGIASVHSASGGSAATPAAIRTSFEGEAGGGGGGSVAGGPALSAASTPYSQRAAALSVPATTASTPAGSQRAAPAAPSARASSSSFRASGDGFVSADGRTAAVAPPPPGSAVQRHISGSDVSGGHGWAVPAAASPAPSVRSNRSGDVGGGAAAASVVSQRSGGGGLEDGRREYGGAAAPAGALSQRSGFGAGGFDTGVASPAAQSHRSGHGGISGGGGFDGGAASPASMSRRSGFGGESGGFARAASPAALSQRSGFGAAASQAALPHRSSHGAGGGVDDDDGYGGGAASPAALSQRSGLSAAASYRSGEFATGLRGYGSTTGSQPRASGAVADDFADDFGGGDDDGAVYDNDRASSVAAPSAASASRRAASAAAASGDLRASGAASPSARSQRSGAGYDNGAFGGGAAAAGSTAGMSHRSLAGFEGGLGSLAAMSQRSGFDDGPASPAAMSQRSGGGYAASGYGGGSHYGGGGYGGVGSAAALSQRSGEFSQGLGKVSSRSSLGRSNNDPMDVY